MQAHKTHILSLLLTQSHTHTHIQRHAITVSALPLVPHTPAPYRSGVCVVVVGEGLIKPSSVSGAKRLPSHSVSPYLSVCLPSLPIHRLPSRFPAPFPASLFACFPPSLPPVTVAPLARFVGSQIIRI